MKTISRADLTIESSITRWGGPAVTITIAHTLFAGETWELKSTEGLDLDHLADGHGIHITREPERRWHGAIKGMSMEEAIDWFVGYANTLIKRDAVEVATCGELMAVRDALSDFEDALGPNTRRDFLGEWEQFKDAVVAVDLALTGALAQRDQEGN